MLFCGVLYTLMMPVPVKYIQCIFELLTPSHVVNYEVATTLTTLTQNLAAIKVAVSCQGVR